MKTFNVVKFACVLALMPPVAASAQTFVTVNDETLESHVNSPENNNITPEGKYNRGAYLTNPWYDNWVIAAAGGAQTLISGYADNQNRGFDASTAAITPSFELSVAKWVTPSVAVRFGFQGFNLAEKRKFYAPDFWNHYTPKYDDTKLYYGQTYLHADIMWSLTNAIWGYKESRFYNCTPYIHSGYLRLYHPDKGMFTKTHRDREIEFGFGIQNTFRITNHIGINADLRWGNISGRYHDHSDGGRVNHFTVFLGASYTFHKWYWNRYNTAVAPIQTNLSSASDALAKAQAANSALQQQNDALAKALAEKDSQLANQPAAVAAPVNDELVRRIAAADLVIYYDINSDRILPTEAIRLDEYVQRVMKADPKHVFYLTGSADKGTGTFLINTRLSHSRPETVKKVLMRKYNIPESQIIIKAAIISDKHADGSLDRCVLFENE